MWWGRNVIIWIMPRRLNITEGGVSAIDWKLLIFEVLKQIISFLINSLVWLIKTHGFNGIQIQKDQPHISFCAISRTHIQGIGISKSWTANTDLGVGSICLGFLPQLLLSHYVLNLEVTILCQRWGSALTQRKKQRRHYQPSQWKTRSSFHRQNCWQELWNIESKFNIEIFSRGKGALVNKGTKNLFPDRWEFSKISSVVGTIPTGMTWDWW